MEATEEAEKEWSAHVQDLYSFLLLRNARSWFTGYNSNVDGHDKLRYMIYNGGSPRYREQLETVERERYSGFAFD